MALLDTAAASSCLHTQFANNNDVTEENVTLPLAASGQQMNVSGKEDHVIRIGTHESRSKCEFSICDDLRVDCIPGYPWLKEQQATLDTQRRCVHIGISERQAIFWQKTPTELSKEDEVQAENFDHGIPKNLIPQFARLVPQYAPVLNQKAPLKGTRTNSSHKIALKNNRPIHTPPYRVSNEKKNLIEEQLGEMLEAGVISPSTSPYCSPVVLPWQRRIIAYVTLSEGIRLRSEDRLHNVHLFTCTPRDSCCLWKHHTSNAGGIGGRLSSSSSSSSIMDRGTLGRSSGEGGREAGLTS